MMLLTGFLIGILSTIVTSFFLRELAAKKRDREFAEIMRIAIAREAEERAWGRSRPGWGQHRGIC